MRHRHPMKGRFFPLSLGVCGLAGLAASLPGCRLTDLFQEEPPATVPAALGPVSLPEEHSLRVSQYVFNTNRELDPEAPILTELADLREQVCKELKLPPADSLIQVYLFEDQDSYQRYMSALYPDLPHRRAFFVAQPQVGDAPDELLVYTFWGEHIRQDLRHELTHALLHSVIREVPLWLDEGLAEFFELPPEFDGVNQTHLLELKQDDDFRPDLARLERLHKVKHMRQAEYREAWAWAHLMRRGSERARVVRLEYLRDLRQGKQPSPLRERLLTVFGQPEVAVAGHVTMVPLPTSHVRR